MDIVSTGDHKLFFKERYSLLLLANPFQLKTTLTFRKAFLLLSYFFLFFLINLFIYLAVLGLHCCAQAFSSCGEQGLLFVAVCRLLIVVASLVVEHGL